MSENSTEAESLELCTVLFPARLHVFNWLGSIFNKSRQHPNPRLTSLKRRYALGEIDKDENEARKKDLR